jgi:hypothetical protein
MEAAEEVLQRVMLATVTGTRPTVSADEVANVLTAFDLQDGDFTVHLHHPEDFLIIFNSMRTRERLSGDHFINDPNSKLSIRPWCKLAHAGCDRFDHRVELDIRGIPPQAWHVSTAEALLGGSCWIERLHPATRSRAHMATFRLTALTHDLAAIRHQAILEVVELVPARLPTQAPWVRSLTYPIDIRIASREVISHAPRSNAGLSDGHGGADSGTEDRGDHRGPPRHRGRKRRRPNSDATPPPGRADGMAMDTPA